MKKRYIKILSFILALLSFWTVASVDGLGYTYDHKGNVIYSTEGLTVNQTPYIYSDLGIDSVSKFSNPTDLFVYTHHETDEKILYLLDGGSQSKKVASTLFILNDQLQVQQEITHFVYNPANFDDETLLAIKSLGQKVVSSRESTDEIKTDTNGVCELDSGFNSLEELKSFDLVKLYLNEASAVYRSYKRNSLPYTDYLYICDKENNQVLVVDYETYDSNLGTFEIVQIITTPKEENVKFRPSKTIVDAAGRIYVIASDVGDGIMEFSADGSFNRYVGTNYTSLSAWDIFWRNFSTEEQLAGENLILQTSFTGMAYKNNMIYATSYAIRNGNTVTDDKNMIKKINPSGKDVLRRNGYTVPMGDYKYSRTRIKEDDAYGPSNLECITVNEYGAYTVVDSTRDRLFTYDNEGNLLYISGGTGTQVDKISSPKAIQYLGENLLVLDADKKVIIIFEPTDIAKVINKAVQCEYEGRADDEIINGEVVRGAAYYWEQVIELNANYEYAYIGIGKKYMNNKDYKNAMYYFELGFDTNYYGKAYKQYRDGIIKQYFAPVMITVIALIVGLSIYKRIRKKKLGIKDEEMTGIGDE